MNHLLSTSDGRLRGQAKIFQLTVNNTSQNLFEFDNTKWVEYAAIAGQNYTSNHLTRLENMEKLLLDCTFQNSGPFCSNSQKPSYFAKSCLALRKCFNCNENCQKMHRVPAIVNSLEALAKECLEPKHLLKFVLVINLILFLHETISQYKVIIRKTQDSLPNRPLSSLIRFSGIGVNGNSFYFDCLVYFFKLSICLKSRRDGSSRI